MKANSYNNSFITYDDNTPWLITYADLMTLLLVFFILLYTLAFFGKEKYKGQIEKVMLQLKQDQELKGVILDLSTSLGRKISIEDITGLRPRNISLFKAINQFVRKTDQSKNITTQYKDGKIIITVSGEILFSSGSAKLSPEALSIFNRMIQIFDNFPDYIINIKGHTDNLPISNQQFPSNWELSAVRATTVLRYLISKGISPQRLTATGYADIMPQVPNTTDKNKEKNRRVEFVLEKNETNN
ncbi:MAG: OmpA family protein [Desulfobacteraceae bacterium]|nr:OmpA family protein [Desulfobacteraceae bacterium]